MFNPSRRWNTELLLVIYDSNYGTSRKLPSSDTININYPAVNNSENEFGKRQLDERYVCTCKGKK